MHWILSMVVALAADAPLPSPMWVHVETPNQATCLKVKAHYESMKPSAFTDRVLFAVCSPQQSAELAARGRAGPSVPWSIPSPAVSTQTP